jgi:hypothetical protein
MAVRKDGEDGIASGGASPTSAQRPHASAAVS